MPSVPLPIKPVNRHTCDMSQCVPESKPLRSSRTNSKIAPTAFAADVTNGVETGGRNRLGAFCVAMRSLTESAGGRGALTALQSLPSSRTGSWRQRCLHCFRAWQRPMQHYSLRRRIQPNPSLFNRICCALTRCACLSYLGLDIITSWTDI
jgi:hypothetical protein